MRSTDSLEKTPVLGKIEGRRRRGWQRMRGLDGRFRWWAWVWASSGSWWQMGSLVHCTPWGCKESDMTEWLNWTDYSALKKKEHLLFAIMWMNYFSSSTFLEFTYIWYYAVFVFLCLDYLTKHNGQRNLAGCKELDITEWLTTQRNREQDGGLQGLGGGVGKWGDVGLRA